MKCRVHYIGPQGQRASKDVVATKEDARAVFSHLYPGVRVDRVESLAMPVRKPAVARPERVEPSARPEIVEQFRALRQRLGGTIPRAGRHPRHEPSNGHWFHRGKEARGLGKPRDIEDGRMTAENRAAFQAGWDEQERFMQPPSDEQRAQSAEIAARLSQWAKENL